MRKGYAAHEPAPFDPDRISRNAARTSGIQSMSASADQAVRGRGYVPHIPQRGEDPTARRRHPHGRARRWVVERTHSWLNRFRKLLVRFEKTAASYEGLRELASASIAYRQVIPISGKL